MNRYTVAQVGCGNRGKVHLDGWLAHPERFEVVGICDLDDDKMRKAVATRDTTAALYTDAARMLRETRPDIFCFSTPPHIRLEMVKLAAEHAVKGLVFEKPMATSLAEARTITELCRQHSIKAAVSHQHKYVTSFRKLRATVAGGDIGEVQRITATCQAWLAQLGTHFVDYVLWANNAHRAQWVVGHVHGRELLADSHPSPNYTMGQIGFENGVRAFVEFGRLSASYMDDKRFWLDNRLTVYGTHGYVWCDTDGGWGMFTRRTGGDMVTGKGDPWRYQQTYILQPLFAADLADWLDDDRKIHPCNLDITYHGYEIMEALCLSAMNNVRVDLPLDPGGTPVDIFERMRQELPDCPER